MAIPQDHDELERLENKQIARLVFEEIFDPHGERCYSCQIEAVRAVRLGVEILDWADPLWPQTYAADMEEIWYRARGSA
jgi:hypothetical protein